MGAWWIEVDGLVLPKPLSGDPGLELVNTRSGWGEPFDDRQDYLRSFDHLVTLAREQGVLETERAANLLGRQTRASERERVRTRRLRTDAHAALTGSASPPALNRLADAARAARSRQRLIPAEHGARWAFSGRPRPSEPLDGLILAVADILASPRAATVASCPGHDCGWLFLNASGRRRWCQMAVCGNRAKQAAWTARQ